MSATDKALKVVAERPAPPPPAPVTTSIPPSVFTADTPVQTIDGARAGFLADLALHGQAATPLTIGLFGRAGSGKSSLLKATLAAADRLGHRADGAGLATPFLANTAALHIGVQPGRSPYTTLLAGAQAGLAASYPALAAEAGIGTGDPHEIARKAADRLNEARHRLDDQRRKLDELSSRQARLMETVLFDGAGSRVDAYARANRGRIDRALRRFGLGGDTTTTYKELVRDAAEPGLGRGLGWLSAFWAYRGQIRLIVVALVFFVLAWLVGLLIDDQDMLLGALRATNDKMAPLADWLAANGHWLSPVRQVLLLAGLASIVMNVVRALRFVQPIARGATLLRGDLDSRRHELDGLVAHQAQRVEEATRDVEGASGRATEAERRAATRPIAAEPDLVSPDDGPDVVARHFFAMLSRSVLEHGRSKSGRAPARLLVALDGFERVAPREAAAFLDAAHDCLTRPGFVTFLAADASHLATGFAETDPALARATLERMVQVPFAIDDGDATWDGARHLVHGLLRSGAVDASITTELDADPGRSAFDKSWLPKEQAVLEALAPLAGTTPRAVKRFVNLYRLARADPMLADAGAADLASLALGLALAGSGSLPPTGMLMDDASLNSDLQKARNAAAAVLGVSLDLGRDSRGLDVARRYSLA